MPSVDAIGHVQRTHSREHVTRRYARIMNKRRIGLAVAHAGIDRDSGMTYQYEIHASPVR